MGGGEEGESHEGGVIQSGIENSICTVKLGLRELEKNGKRNTDRPPQAPPIMDSDDSLATRSRRQGTVLCDNASRSYPGGTS